MVLLLLLSKRSILHELKLFKFSVCHDLCVYMSICMSVCAATAAVAAAVVIVVVFFA